MRRRQFLTRGGVALLGGALAPKPLAGTPLQSAAGRRAREQADLSSLRRRLVEEVPGVAAATLVPGFVAAVYHGGSQIDLAHGVANLNTGAEMTTDTGWLLGSVTKILVTTLIMRAVETGRVDLDERVTTYLPELRLSEAGAAEKIRVRHLLNHTNGIDADTLMPTTDYGPGALRSYVEKLVHCGTLFEPGQSIHYSNPGFTLAGRILEVVHGRPFNGVMEADLYAPVGMGNSSTSAEQAILRRTAVGSFPDPSTGRPRATAMFMLPVSGAGAGTTTIVTTDDMIAFGRTHLNGGIAPNGNRVLSRESTALMQTETFDVGTPPAPPIGLGWWRFPIGGTTALFHGGGSPGGRSSLAVFPELDLIVVSFGNGSASGALHDRVVESTLDELFDRSVEAPYERGPAPRDLGRYEGTYSAFQNRAHVRAVEDEGGGQLELTLEFVPFDDEHDRFMAEYRGGSNVSPPVRFTPVSETVFTPAARPHEAMYGLYGRMGLLGIPEAAGGATPSFIHSQFRYSKRDA